jgi:hypothetical protein
LQEFSPPLECFISFVLGLPFIQFSLAHGLDAYVGLFLTRIIGHVFHPTISFSWDSNIFLVVYMVSFSNTFIKLSKLIHVRVETQKRL